MKTVIFQSAKLGDIPEILEELDWAKSLLPKQQSIDRIFGISGGCLPALAFALELSARRDPLSWQNAAKAIDEFKSFLGNARSRNIRAFNLNPLFGFYNLNPLKRWISRKINEYRCLLENKPGTEADTFRLTDLAIPLYLCAIDRDGIFTVFGPPSDRFRFQYISVRVGPPEDAPIVDALIAGLSTLLSTDCYEIKGKWYRDCRPAIVDAGAIVSNLIKSRPKDIIRTQPKTKIRNWRQNWFTSSFIMHSQNERNQTLLAAYYLDLFERQKTLEGALVKLEMQKFRSKDEVTFAETNPIIRHIDLPYVGSTEAFTNMRHSVRNKEHLISKFENILEGQLDDFPFDLPANIIYGAGGFSGILGGLVTTKRVNAGFELGQGKIQHIYGVSAGVLNGFFHAVQLAARNYPDLYRPTALNALYDLEAFISKIELRKIASINKNPIHLWKAFANLNPLKQFLLERIQTYTGSRHPDQITFDDIGLPLTIAAARLDGYTDFLGITHPERKMFFGEKEWFPLNTPLISALLAGWSMNTYITPTKINGQSYCDGGGTFYDIGLFAALMDPSLTNLLNIHLDEPEGHSYNLPPRPNLIRIVFDTHNYIFPEERRRMRLLTDLLFDHDRLRQRHNQIVEKMDAGVPLYIDFRREWKLTYHRYRDKQSQHAVQRNMSFDRRK